MSVLVEQQNETVDNIYTQAEGVQNDTEAAWVMITTCPPRLLINVSLSLQYTDKAVVSARAARKKRWICFFIIVIVLAVIAIILGIVISREVADNKKNSST